MDIFKKLTKSSVVNPIIIGPPESESLKLEDAREILDLFNWDNIEAIEMEGYVEDDKYKPVRNIEISKSISYYVLIKTPSREDLNYIIAKKNDINIEHIYAHFKGHTEIHLNLKKHILKLNGEFTITMKQITEKIGFPLNEIIIE